MAALKNNVLRDHLCWLWRVGDESSHPVLSQAALLSEQVLRILGVEHSSLDHLLCQVSTRSARGPAFYMAMPIRTCASWGQGNIIPQPMLVPAQHILGLTPLLSRLKWN